MANTKTHWNKIYNQKSDLEVSWFQENPKTSIKLIEKYLLKNKEGSIIDIGGGNSLLASVLIGKGYKELSVLDISEIALEKSRKRNPDAPVKWIESSILDFNPDDNFNLWHDRAVFHFLTEKADIEKYVKIAKQYVLRDGHLILAAFSETGPEKCSGLPITQYSKEKFCKLFEPDFQLQECFEEVHQTPFGTMQDFIWAIFKRK